MSAALTDPAPSTRSSANQAVGKPGAWPRYSRNEALALTQVSQRARSMELPIGGQAWQVSLEPLAPSLAARWQLPADACLVSLRWAGAPFAAWIDAPSLSAWLQAHAGDVQLPDVSSLQASQPASAPLLQAWLEVALDQIRGPIEGLNRGALTVEALESVASTSQALAPSLPHALSLKAQPAQDGQAPAIDIKLHTDSLGLMLLSGAVAKQMPHLNTVEWDNLPMLLRADIGLTRLSVAEWQATERGDVIVFDDTWLKAIDGSGYQLRLTAQSSSRTEAAPARAWGGFEVSVSTDAQQLMAISAWTQWEVVMSDVSLKDETVSSAKLEDLPVLLSFDLGQRSMNLAQLQQLQPGQVIDLARPLSAAVNIRANGALVGTGELAEIDGRLGVTIASLHQPG